MLIGAEERELERHRLERTEGGNNSGGGVQFTPIICHCKMAATPVNQRSSRRGNPEARSLWKETDRFKTSNWNTSHMQKSP